MSNVFSFIGTCGKDAEVRYLPSGKAVLSVSLANNIGFGDKQQTLWVRVALWGKRAEGNLKTFLVKGQQVFVSGELTMSEYKANDSTNKTQLELNANIIELIGGKKDDNNTPKNQPINNQQSQHYANKANGYAPSANAPQYDNFDAPYDNNIPF